MHPFLFSALVCDLSPRLGALRLLACSHVPCFARQRSYVQLGQGKDVLPAAEREDVIMEDRIKRAYKDFSEGRVVHD